jgi:hypothetical protein
MFEHEFSNLSQVKYSYFVCFIPEIHKLLNYLFNIRPLSKTVRFNVLKVIPAGSKSGAGKKVFTAA